MKMNADDLPLGPEVRRQILERCPDLGGKVDADLVEKFELVKYDRDHTFHSFDSPLADRPLRVVVLGHVNVVQRRGRDQVTRSCGPMTTFGEESVKAWSEAKVAGGASAMEAISAITKSVIYVLELPASKFPEVFGAPGGDNPLLARLLGAYDVHEIAPELVQALSLCPELAEVDAEGLYQMLEGAEIRHVCAGEMLAPEGAPPASAFLLLERGNGFELRGSSGGKGKESVTLLPAPACAGLGPLIKVQALEASIHAHREATVVALRAETFWSLFKLNADFQRAIARSNGLDLRAGQGFAGPPSATNIFLMLPGVGIGKLPIRGLTDLLAESIASHLYDSVLVVHLVRKPLAGEASMAQKTVLTQVSDRAWVEHCWIEIGASLLEDFRLGMARRAAATSADPPEPDVTLVEIAELGDTTRFLGELEEVTIPFKVVHISDRPDALPPIPFVAAGVGILYTGLLEETKPVLGMGAAAHLAGDAGAAQTTMDVTTSAAKNVGILAKRTLESLRNLRANALGKMPAAWPLGTVRLRLPKALLEKLTSTKSPCRFEDLGEKLARETRPTMERWARAVTTRRVGLALGGGGTYGDVHVPFIKALIAQGVPIDMVSGSSVGSTIGAYYCGLDLDGLDLYWKHRSMILAAGWFGFISSSAVEIAMAYDFGQLQLDQTDIPFFPVVTDADIGVESYLSKGTYAFGVRASGSLPPLLGPTVQGDRRYLDGGLVANVPVNVLGCEGAALIIASNPIGRVTPRTRRTLGPVPVLGVILRESDPFVRIEDAARMLPMIFGVAGESQAENADVVYRPAAGDTSLTEGFSRDFEERVRNTVALKKAVAEVVNTWRASLGNPPSRIRLVGSAEQGWKIELDGWVGFVGTGGAIDPVSLPLLVELAEFLVEHQEILLLTVAVSGASRAVAAKQAERVKALLVEKGVASTRLAAAGSESSALPAADALAKVVEPQLTLPVGKLAETYEEQAKLREALEYARGEAALARQRDDAEALTLAAKEQALEGDLDVGGLLAIEAARLTRSPAVDEALRIVLGRRGRVDRSIAVPEGYEAQRVAWSPDGALIAVGSRDGVVRIWDARAPQPAPLATVDHTDANDKAVLGVVFSEDGSRIASVGYDRQVRVHELRRGPEDSLELKAIFQVDVGTWDQWGVAFSPDGARVLVTWGSRSCLAIFRVDDGSSRPLHVLQGKGTAGCEQAAWEPGGERVAAAMRDGTAVIWSAATGEALETIATGERGAALAAWHPSGGHLAVACQTTAAIHDLRTPGKPPPPLALEGHRRAIVGLGWSDDGSHLVTASRDMTARIWRTATGAFQMSLRGIEGHFVGAAFRPKSVKVVATWSDDGVVTVWSAETGEAHTPLLGHTGSIGDARWSPDGARLATVSTDATARIWAPEVCGQVTYLGHAESKRPPVTTAAFAPDGSEQAVTACLDGSAHVWSTKDGKLRGVLVAATPGDGPAAASFSPTGKLIALAQAHVAVPLLFHAGDLGPAVTLAPPGAAYEAPLDEPPDLRWSPDGSLLAAKLRTCVVVWSASSGAVVRTIASPHALLSICWSPDGARLAVAQQTAGEAVAIWNAQGAEPARTRLAHHDDGVWSVDYSADGRRVATGSNDALARVYDSDTGALLTAMRHNSAVRAVALSPDGRWLATSDDAQKVTIWDWANASAGPASGACAHQSRIRQITWTADSLRLISVSEEGIVCLWERRDVGEAASFVTVGTLRSPHCGFQVASVSPDGKHLVTGDDEGSAVVHPIAFDALVEAVKERLGRKTLTDQEWSRFMPCGRPLQPESAGKIGR